jgi:sec-independent protein translocase protein TatA
MYPMIGMPGGWELVLIVLVILLLFGAKKLPELARGSGQALRIFKSETKGLSDDDKSGDRDGADPRPDRTDTRTTPEQRELEARQRDPHRLGEERGDGTVA